MGGKLNLVGRISKWSYFFVSEIIGWAGIPDDLTAWSAGLKVLDMQVFDLWLVRLTLIISGGLVLTCPQWWPWFSRRTRELYSRLLPESEREKQKDELERRLSDVRAERDSYKERVGDNKKELDDLEAKLAAAEAESTVFRFQLDNCQILADHYKQLADDKEKELSDLRTKYSSLQEQLGKSVLWASGKEFKPRRLSVAVQHVETRDVELASRIRGLLTYYLLDDRTLSRDEYDVKHILIPFTNPSSDTPIVIFSDDEVGSNVKDAFNRYNLIGEKVTRFEKSFAEGKVPDVDITVIVFPERAQ